MIDVYVKWYNNQKGMNVVYIWKLLLIIFLIFLLFIIKIYCEI